KAMEREVKGLVVVRDPDAGALPGRLTAKRIVRSPSFERHRFSCPHRIVEYAVKFRSARRPFTVQFERWRRLRSRRQAEKADQDDRQHRGSGDGVSHMSATSRAGKAFQRSHSG